MRLLIITFGIIFLYSCLAKKNHHQSEKITAIGYINKLPIVLSDGKHVNFGDTTLLYYYQDLIIYQLPYVFDSTQVSLYVKADSIAEKHILTETRYNYFVAREGSRSGMWYKSLDQLSSQKPISTDSILKRLGALTNLQSIIRSPNVTLVERLSLNKGNTIIEKYIPDAKLDETYNDTTFLYYSRALKSIKFSLSPSLDSLTNSKLYKVRIAYNEAYSQKYSITMPQRDIVYEIVKVEPKNLIKVWALIDCFKKGEKSLQ